MTSLSAQLRSLQIPDTLSVLNIQNKQASILFEAQEAADIDIDTVFSIGRAGLEELIDIDPDFVKFEKTLFSENIKSLVRTLQPKEFNEKLDKKVNEFLVCLSPYFLTKPAQKALEWLIRRFRLHVFNVDALISCVLPFHETNLFSRVLRIITISKQTEKWTWLVPTQKLGTPLSKQTIIQHCLSDGAFLTFVCEMIPQAIEAMKNKSFEKLKTLFSFYASILLGIAESPRNLNETRIANILPYMFRGLKSEVVDYKSSSYLILSQMFLMKSFQEQTFLPLVNQICKSLSADTMKLGILTLECIYRKHKSMPFPNKSLKRISESNSAVSQVLELCENNAITGLLPALLAGFLNSALVSAQSDDQAQQQSSSNEIAFFKIFQAANLEGAVSKHILGKLLEQYFKLRKISNNSRNLVKLCQKLMQMFDKRYPAETDIVVQEFVSKHSNKCESEWLQELFMDGDYAAKFKMLPGTESLLVISLNHPDPARRKLAVQELVRTLTSQGKEAASTDFTKNSLRLRLYDDDDAVVQEVLKAGNFLLQFVGVDALIDFFIEKLENVVKFSNRLELAAKIIEIFKDYGFSNMSDQRETKLIYSILPCFLPSLNSLPSQSCLYKMLLESNFGSQNVLIVGIRAALEEIGLKKIEAISEDRTLNVKIHSQVFKTTAALLGKHSESVALIESAMEFSCTSKTYFKFDTLLFGVLFNLLDHLTEEEVLAFVAKFGNFIKSKLQMLSNFEGKEKHVKELLGAKEVETMFSETITQEKAKTVSSSVVCLFFKKLVQKLPVAVVVDGCLTPQEAHVMIFEMLASVSGRNPKKHPFVLVFRLLLQEFLKIYFQSPKALLDFLSHIFMKSESFDWLVNNRDVYRHVDVNVCALHIFKVCIETLNKGIDYVTTFNSEVLPTLVLLLHHPLKIMREASMGCIQALSDNNRINIDDGLKYLLNCIVSSDTEVVAARVHICHVFQKLFKPLCSTSSDVEMVEPKRLEDIRLLAKYFSAFILRSDISLKLGIATVTSSTIFQEFLLHLIPVIEELTTKAQTDGLQVKELNLLIILLQKFTPDTVDIFKMFPSSLRVFKSALSVGRVCRYSDLSVQEECLKQVTPKFFEAISSDKIKSELFDLLLYATVNSSNSSVSKLIRAKITELPISSGDIAHQLANFKEEHMTVQPGKAKRAKRDVKELAREDASMLIESPNWSKIIVLLEVIQLKPNVVFNEELILSIFGMLSLCLEVNATNQPSIEYMKQLLLGSLYRSIEDILTSGQKEMLPQEKFSIEKIIECFRTSENPQTHHQALLVLGKAASLFPDLVLHNIMKIFTFMGANVLRQDDSYSFEVIKRTIDSVIPTLVTAGSPEDAESSTDDLMPKTDDIIKLVVRVFVDAVPYIPEHRRVMLFSHLSKILGAEKNLYVLIAILVEKLTLQMALKNEQDQQPADGAYLDPEFRFSLMKSFSIQEQTTTITKLVQFVSFLPDEHQEETKQRRRTRTVQRDEEELVPLFDAKKHSTREIRQYKYQIIGFISQVLSKEDFVNKANAIGSSEMEALYQRLLEQILQFNCQVVKNGEKDTKASSLRYWKAQQHRGVELMVKVYNLLDFHAFVNITLELLQNESPLIRKKAIESVGGKVKEAGEFSRKEKERLLDVANKLLELSKASSSELPTNKHAALQTLKPLIKLLANSHAKEVKEYTPDVMKVISSSDTSPQIVGDALLCIGELCSTLSVHVIEFMPNFMPPLLQLLEIETRGSELLYLNALMALQNIIVSLSNFMSPYLTKILNILTYKDHDSTTNKASPIQGQIKSKMSSLQEDISKSITPRVLLPAIDTCFKEIVSSKKHSVSLLMKITHHAIDFMTNDSIQSNHTKLLALFVEVFDIRQLYSWNSEREVNEVEGNIIDAFCALVMKLSENIFRPMFLKIFTWSTTSNENSVRLITFYRLCAAIAEKLKGLFLLFAGHIIKPCAELISKCSSNSEESDLFGNKDAEKTNLLLIQMFDCLERCFKHDSRGFLNKERFEYLMTPLVEQIDNEMGGTDVYKERMSNHLIPCLASFAVAVNDESCWKTLNYQILLKSRNQSSQVRLATLKLLEQIHKRIGESYLTLLPETIPFLAELMEDESFEVEKQCQHVISRMEEILGESLQKYF